MPPPRKCQSNLQYLHRVVGNREIREAYENKILSLLSRFFAVVLILVDFIIARRSGDGFERLGCCDCVRFFDGSGISAGHPDHEECAA